MNPNFSINIFKFSSASFKTNITFCYLAFKFLVCFAKSSSEMYTPSIGLAQVWRFISYMRIGLPNYIFNISICIILSCTKFVCWAIVCIASNNSMHTNTIFHYGQSCAFRFDDHKYFSNFLGTVPTFGFRISIVENVRSENFIKNWLSEIQKFYRISLLLEWPT